MKVPTMESFTSDPQSKFLKLIAFAILEQGSQGKTQSQAEVCKKEMVCSGTRYTVLWYIGTWVVSRYKEQMGELMPEVVQTPVPDALGGRSVLAAVREG